MDAQRAELEGGVFNWNRLMLFLLSLAVVTLCLFIIWPFLPGITGAVVLAVVTARPHKWLRARMKSHALAAVVALLLVVLSIVTPTLLVVQSVAVRVAKSARGLQTASAEQGFRVFLAQHPRVDAALLFLQLNVDSDQVFEKGISSIAGKIVPFLGHSISAIFQVVVMLFILFFLYRDQEDALSFVRSQLPFAPEETDFLFVRLRTSVQALVLGRFAVAGIQGLVAGAAFALLGMNGAVLLGVATMLCAMVPGVGAFIVWLPVVIYLAALHLWVQAAILLAVGALVISTLDNFLYPILVGSHLRLHTVPIFLAMLGGVLLFGVCGLVLGPIVFNIAAVLGHIWRSRTLGEPLPAQNQVV